MLEISNIILYFLFFAAIYFQIFLVITFFEKKSLIKNEEKQEKIKKYPSTTIIVPCWNEELTISKTIQSLLNLDYPKNKLKIFIIDDGSTDNTFKIIQQFKNNDRIKIFHKENGGKYTALNLGLQHVKTELVGCLDADSFVETDTLKKIVRYFNNQKTMAVTPAIKVYNPSNVIELIQNMEYKLGIFLRKMLALLGSLYITPGPFSILRKKVFDNIGPYRHGHNVEDLEIALRMQSKNYKIENAHQAYIYTVVPKTLVKLYKQRTRWIQGFLKNAIDYRNLFFKKKYGNLGIFILPISVLSIFFALYFITKLIINIASYMIDKFIQISVIGFNFSLPSFNFDWFFINTGTVALLAYTLFILTFIFILIGKRMVEGKLNFSLDLFLYFFLYGLIAPFWMAKSVYNIIFNKKPIWQ